MSTIFPAWTNKLPPLMLAGSLAGSAVVIGVVWYTFTPKFWEVGYMPNQPGSGFPHDVHAGLLGMDCRYCHSRIEESPEANIPTAQTCMNCHTEGRLSAEIEDKQKLGQPLGPDGQPISKVQFVRDAAANDESIPWRRIHKLPDYVRNFPHNVHVNAGVSCVTCHGVIGRMNVVNQAEPLSMGWCLNCHRDPAPNLVPPDMVTQIFQADVLLHTDGYAETQGKALLNKLEEKPLHLLPENCGACHY